MSFLKGIDPDLLDGALTIVKTLRRHGFETFLAGGVVRDLILGTPVSDIDVATAAAPDEVERLFPKTVPVGKEFGVILVVEGSHNYEVTTFREESDYQDGRHPGQVRFSDARSDVQRRDFTVNALFLDPETEEVVDFVEGKRDLERKLIRTVGSPDLRFEEDQLRVLRAVRLACQLGFEIDPDTYRQVCAYAQKLDRVSAERIRDELLKILTGPAPERGLQLLQDCGIMAVILPEVAAMDGVPQPPQFHPEGDVFRHTCLMFELSEGLDEVLALGVLLHDVGKPPTLRFEDRIRFHGHAELGTKMAEKICRDLRLANDQIEEVMDLVRDHLRFIHVKEMRESTLKRFLRKSNFDKHMELHRLDCLASHGDLSSYHFCLEKLEEFSREVMRPKPLINGHDLIEMGFQPGPLFSEILTGLEDLQLEGKITSREEAQGWVEEHFTI